MAKRGSGKSAGKTSGMNFTASADHRIVVLHGSEDYLIREYTDKVETALRERYGEFERFDFNGSDVSLADLLDELRSYGLLQQHKLVVLNEADKFMSPGGEDTRNRRAMEHYAQNPVEDATLLMRATGWRPGKFDKIVQEIGAVHKCDSPEHGLAVTWCRRRCAKRYDADIDRQATDMLIELVGVNLSRLDSELEKLATYVGPGETIKAADVTTMVGMTREQLAWTIQEAICSGDPATAVTQLRELIDVSQHKTPPMMWAVIDLTRKLHAVTALLSQGENPRQYMRLLKLWGSVGNKVMDAARSLTPAATAQLLRQAIEIDRRTKSGFGNDERSLEALTVSVADTMSRG